MDIFSVLSLIGGLVLFLFGMDLMGDSLKKLAGGKLESILAKLTSNRFKGFLLGFAVTAVIQSSSATTVMLVGFVNSGIMKLGQTIAVILGANIGTTVTSWLLSTADIGGTAILLKLLKPSSFTPVLAAIGFIMGMVSKDDGRKNIGTILIGFAILMFGMDAMSGAVEGLRDNAAFTNLLTKFKNPVMGVLVGALFTAVIQSSSASVGVLQALALSCNVPFAVAIPVIMGQNIGTTITPIISSFSGNRDSKRVAFSCLYIKMVDVLVVGSLFYLINHFVNFEFMSESEYVSATNVAVIHTAFNVISGVALLPLCSLVEKLAIVTVRGKAEEKETDVFDTLDDRFLDVTSFAIEKCKELVCDMMKISITTFNKAKYLFDNFTMEEYKKVEELENTVDKYEDKISTYLVKIAATQMSAKESKTVTELLHVISDIERVSDHARNLSDIAKEVHEKKVEFSLSAKKDISIMASAVAEILDLSYRVLVYDDMEVAKKVEPLEQVIDRLNRKIKKGHVNRLQQGDCTMELGFILMDILNSYERISDHCSNIAACFIEIAHDSFEIHEYLNQLKSGLEETELGKEFAEMYESYKQKYYIQ